MVAVPAWLQGAQALKVYLPRPRSRGQSRSRRAVGAGHMLHLGAGTRVETVTLKRGAQAIHTIANGGRTLCSNPNNTTVLGSHCSDDWKLASSVCSVGDAAHAVGVDVRRHGLGQREAPGAVHERCACRVGLAWTTVAPQRTQCIAWIVANSAARSAITFHLPGPKPLLY